MHKSFNRGKFMRNFILALMVLVALPVCAKAADRVVALDQGHALAEAVRLGEATGGPAVRELVSAEIAEKVFTSEHDGEPANGWFNRTYRAALRTNGFLAKKPELARYELTAEVGSMSITPLLTGTHHNSVVTYRLRDIAKGEQLWEQTQSMDFDVNRGMRFGAIGGAIGAAAGGAMTGQNPAVTAAMITNQRPHRPFDVRIDVYEGIMRGFQRMAEKTMIELAGVHLPQQ
ncbi:MAG TPA: hypothetical protein VJM09_16545 [Sphingobium sp.]|nr:hypothetical protein [Sphingobium sp.]